MVDWVAGRVAGLPAGKDGRLRTDRTDRTITTTIPKTKGPRIKGQAYLSSVTECPMRLPSVYSVSNMFQTCNHRAPPCLSYTDAGRLFVTSLAVGSVALAIRSSGLPEP